MTIPLTAPEILQREFLEIRAKILELAAAFDRLDRSSGSVADDQRIARIHEALEVLATVKSDRAEQVQLVFSRPYDQAWTETLKMSDR